MIFKAVLSNKSHPEYGAATIPFPIPDDQYDSTIDLLDGIGIGAAVAQDCRVEEVPIGMPILNRLVAQSVNVDELDYLAKRLDGFSKGEGLQFQAMASVLSLSDIKDLINLTFCCQHATIITDFSDLEQIGKDHSMNINGGSMPMDEYQALDGQSIALDLIQTGTGVVTPYGVAYDNGMVLEQSYNGHQFPAYLYDSRFMVLEITPKFGLEEDQNPEYLYLPASEQQFERTLLRAGIRALYDAQVRLDFDELPEKVAEALDLESLSGSDLPDLNRMCRAIHTLSDEDTEKLNAVVLMTETSGAVSIRLLAENLDQFDFIPGIQTPEEYGRHMIQESGQFEYDKNLEGFYNYRFYGEQHIQQEGGQFTECGYVVYRGVVPLAELLRTTPPEQHQQEQGMGGMM